MSKQDGQSRGHATGLLAFLLVACGGTTLGPVGPNVSRPPPDSARQSPGVEERKASLEKAEKDLGLDPVQEALDESLIEAAKEGYWLKVVSAMDDGANGESLVGVAGITGLHIACLLGSLDEVKQLHGQGADVSVTTDRNETPLHLAALSGAEDVIGFLMDAGADMAAVDHEDRSVLHWAILGSGVDVVKYLVDVKSVAATFDPSGGYPPLVAAIQSENLDTVKFLISEGAIATLADVDGFTPLHHAAASNELEIATFLISKGAKASAKNDAGKTSLHVLAQDCEAGESCLVLAQLLVKKGAKKSSVDADGNTAGEYAVARGDVAMGSFLVGGK
jgi:ankyrin repeat protein